MTLSWSELDARAVKMSRALAADAVQNAGNGHPGTAMALAPVAYLIFQKHLRHNPKEPNWAGRDRFVLSIGHSSMTLYTQLFLSGYGLHIEDIKSFRKEGSLTPGHPEFGHTAGVETTTGPLGQGIANAVGMALALKHQAATIASADFSDLFDQQVYVLAGDGCLQEGVSAEASSLAGHLELDNLILIYDDNKISIDGATDLAFSEDVAARYRSYGWQVIEVPKLPDGDVDLEALDTALKSAKDQKLGPTLIRLETTIAWPAPNLQNTAKAHGAPLGDDEIAATKTLLGLDPEVKFFVDEAALAHARKVGDRGAADQQEWTTRISDFKIAEPHSFSIFESFESELDANALKAALPQFEVGSKIATRKAGSKVLNSLVKVSPKIRGGSADLAESNGTWIEQELSYSAGSPSGLNIHFGIREHAMGGILNGMALTNFHPYGGTFLVFSDYMRGAVRLSALMNIPVTYVWTHDSIGLGEDGPTHQPVEHLAALRLIPNFSVVRPADGNETAAAWFEILKRSIPAGIALSRQDLPVVVDAEAALSGVARGGYLVLQKADATISIIATGSEVSLALSVAEALDNQGIKANVVSMPCVEWFEAESIDYQQSVIPKSHFKVSIEAGATASWYKFVQDGLVVGLDHFGESADPTKLFHKYGFNVDAIVKSIVEKTKKANK